MGCAVHEATTGGTNEANCRGVLCSVDAGMLGYRRVRTEGGWGQVKLECGMYLPSGSALEILKLF